MGQRIALYPASFDALTNGHLDIIRRAAALFDKVIVAVARNMEKQPLFSVAERLQMLRELTADIPNVEIADYDGLTIEFAKKIGAQFIIRGLRFVSDFEYELQLALMNLELDGNIETIFMVPSVKYSFLSSRIVKEVASLGGDVSEFVPPLVEKRLREKLKPNK